MLATEAIHRALFFKYQKVFVLSPTENQAKELAETVISKAKPETVRPLAYPLLIAIFDNLQNTEQAIETSKTFIEKYKDNFLVPSVMENLARLYETVNNVEESKKVYEQIINSFQHTIDLFEPVIP